MALSKSPKILWMSDMEAPRSAIFCSCSCPSRHFLLSLHFFPPILSPSFIVRILPVPFPASLQPPIYPGQKRHRTHLSPHEMRSVRGHCVPFLPSYHAYIVFARRYDWKGWDKVLGTHLLIFRHLGNCRNIWKTPSQTRVITRLYFRALQRKLVKRHLFLYRYVQKSLF